MGKVFSIFIFISALAFCVSGQTPAGTPPADDVVRITTTLIQIDVTVTDKDGKPVSDLTQDEIEIYENGELQKISNFSFVSSGRVEARKEPDNPDAGLPDTRRRIDPADVHRTIALVVDDLALSFESTHFVRRALKNFVDNQMQEGDLVAIVRTGGGIGALQQFTTNKELLYAAIEKIRFNLMGNGTIGAFAPIIQDQVADQQQNLAAETESEFLGDDGDIDETRRQLFGSGTLGGISFVVRGMRELPGRKAVVLLSDGFRISRINSRGFLEHTSLLDPLRELVDECNRSAVVVYSVDAKGLQTGGFTAVDSLGAQNAIEIESRLADRRRDIYDTQDGLFYLASQTGGQAFFNSNDLGKGIQRALDDQSYYLVGYQPDAEVFDPQERKYNKLEVKVLRDNVKVRYRSGFFGVTDAKTVQPLGGRTAEEKLNYALSSPFSINDLKLDLHAFFKGATKKEMTVDAFLYIDVNELGVEEGGDGRYKASLDLLMMNFGESGLPTGEMSQLISIDLDKDRFESLKRQGLVYTVTFPVKKSGGYQLRAAVRDRKTDKVGSASQFINVPNIGKKRLALSGIVVNNITYETWNRNAGAGDITILAERLVPKKQEQNQFTDTALRKFPAGSILVYALEAYNIRAANSDEVRLVARLIKDGEVVFTGNALTVDLRNRTEASAVNLQGAINLAIAMEPGDYALQIILSDAPAKKKPRTVSQYIQFEVVK